MHFLASCVTCTTSFDLQMSCGGHDAFAMVISFNNNLWKPTHITMKCFQVLNITCATMANQIKVLLDSFTLLDKIITYVKGERFNLSTLIMAFTSVITCVLFQLSNPFVFHCFGHTMRKSCHYSFDDDKTIRENLRFSTMVSTTF